MKQWTEKDINWFLEELAKNDPQHIAGILDTGYGVRFRTQPLKGIPTGNVKVIAHLERLSKDRRWVMEYVYTFISYKIYGEICWLAARVLAYEYAYLGIEKPIILKDVVQPIADYEIAKTDNKKTIDELFEQGLLPTATEIIKPQDYAYCCSKEAVEERLRNRDKDK